MLSDISLLASLAGIFICLSGLALNSPFTFLTGLIMMCIGIVATTAERGFKWAWSSSQPGPDRPRRPVIKVIKHTITHPEEPHINGTNLGEIKSKTIVDKVVALVSLKPLEPPEIGTTWRLDSDPDPWNGPSIVTVVNTAPGWVKLQYAGGYVGAIELKKFYECYKRSV